MTLTQELLDRIAGILNRDATNYTVFLRLYKLSIANGSGDLGAYIRKAVGTDAEIGGTEEIGVAELLAEMGSLLMYAGDPGAGPNDLVLKSTEFSRLLSELNECTSELANQAERIERFWLKAGHPAYPVFWDFAYILLKRETATILIGSSSD
jgi:hypothetical protein